MFKRTIKFKENLDPFVQDLIKHCLHPKPYKRPSIDEILNHKLLLKKNCLEKAQSEFNCEKFKEDQKISEMKNYSKRELGKDKTNLEKPSQNSNKFTKVFKEISFF